MKPKDVRIQGDMILLQSLLKLVGAIGNGGEVKFYLAQEEVRVNGELENRRGRKLYGGDTVLLSDGSAYRVIAEASPRV